MLETERLVLRRWEEGDAEDLFQYASNPDVDRLLAGRRIRALRKVLT